MGQRDSRTKHPIRRARPERCRRDGWTVERQLGFLAALLDAKSISSAAAAVGMSRESAYRLRERPNGALFAALWDRILQPEFRPMSEGHIGSLSDGRLMRVLGMQYRRERGDFGAIGSRGTQRRGT